MPRRVMRAVATAGLIALAGWSPAAGAEEPIKIGLEIPLSPPGDPAAGQRILILHYTQPNQDWRQADVLLEHVGTAP